MDTFDDTHYYIRYCTAQARRAWATARVAALDIRKAERVLDASTKVTERYYAQRDLDIARGEFVNAIDALDVWQSFRRGARARG